MSHLEKKDLSHSSNPFEAGHRKVIPAVLVYVQRGDQVLMIHRNSSSGRWNGLGGKLELNESPVEGAARELKEESGLSVPLSQFQPLGVLQFPNFKPHKNEDWMVFVFTVPWEKTMAEPFQRCEEGELHWVPAESIASLNLWPGDTHFIPLIIKRHSFIGTLWYEQENGEAKLSRVWIQTLS